jgi:hypothetical protein
VSNGIPFGVGRRFAAELLHGEVDGRGTILAVGHVADPEHDLIRALRAGLSEPSVRGIV